jgi:hypothetical protein
VEGIGDLSDAYLAIEPGVKRTKFLFDNFGRSGADLARVMELGSDKIRELGDSIEGTGLLMTQEGIEKAEQYRLAMDALNDSALSAKITFGSWAAPGASAGLDFINKLMQGKAKAADAAEFINDFFAGSIFETSAHKAERVLGDMGGKQEWMQQQTERTTAALDANQEAVYEGAWAYQAYSHYLERGRLAQIEYEQGLREVAGAADEAAVSISHVIDQTNRNIGSAITDMIADIDWVQAGGGNIERAFEAVKQAWMNQKITDAQAEEWFHAMYLAEQELQLELDNIDASQAAQNISTTLGVTLSEAWKIVQQMMQDQSATYTVDVIWNNLSGDAGGLLPGVVDPKSQWPGGANGLSMVVPPGYPNDSFFVRASSGERVDITKGGQGGGGAVNITQNFYDAGAAALGMAEVATIRRARLNASM